MTQKFVLASDYSPTGDQPTAIATLIGGLEKGEKEQTLLGVTGSGKSVIGDTFVILEKNGYSQQVPISAVDGLFSLPLSQDGTATQFVSLNAGSLKTVAFDPMSGAVDMCDVREVSRHRYKGELFSVNTADGSQNIFTDSHNVYVLRGGDVRLVRSSDIRIGDRVPEPSTLKDSGAYLRELQVSDYVASEDLYLDIAESDIKKLSPALGYRKAWAVSQRNGRVSMAAYAQLQQAVQVLTVGSRHRTAAIPATIPVSPALLRFLGLFIAEGHASHSYITISTIDASIVDEFQGGADVFHLALRKRKKVPDYHINSTVLVKLLKEWCGSHAETKQLPSFWPQLSKTQLKMLLGGIFAGDGYVEVSGIGLGSISYQLLSGVKLALTRFGIQSRIHKKKVRYAGDERSTWLLTVTGRENVIQFQRSVGFGLERKDMQLQQLVNKFAAENTNVDVFPLTPLVAMTMKRYGLLQREVATVMGINRTLVSMYLSGLRTPSRPRAQHLFEYLARLSMAHGDASATAAYQQLHGLAELVWSPVTAIEREQTDTTVYDLSVPGRQTFLANNYFVHNTFTMANIIAERQVPTLILAHNKTLAAQLYSEFKSFFPDNEVHYFVSYFDYYQPEAYIASSDTYIEKDSKINDEIDRLRHAATTALLTRRDTIIVASVSCIYGIGSPDDYAAMSILVQKGERRLQDKFVRQLTDIQYQRNDIDFHRGTFRVKGDVVDVFPAGSDVAYRFDFFGDEVERITRIDPLTGEILAEPDQISIFPSSHYVTPKQKVERAIIEIKREFEERMDFFEKHDKHLEAQRLAQRTKYDLEMLEETGFVKGIENYSRYLTNREVGEQPATLLDYFPDDFLLFVDESHMTLPQVRGMYNGDRARKEVLVEHGFRMPSALDNRPLTFDEFNRHINKAIYVSATPSEYELSHSPEPAQQIIRPTGLIDPEIIIRPTDGQIDDLIAEIRDRVAKNQRVLVTTLTKRMAEDLSTYLQELDIKTAYIHSEVDTLERGDILKDLRLGVYDVLVGINLLREGLDLPEVSMVAIIDADKEGFLRSASALIQIIGRAARHLDGKVFMYADHITKSMQQAIDETDRRRTIQTAYNAEHDITPVSIAKKIDEGLRAIIPKKLDETPKIDLRKIPKDEYSGLVKELSGQMELASANLEFEKAAELRDIIADIKSKM